MSSPPRKLIRASTLARSRIHLVGRRVYTFPMGCWTGGVCTIIEVAPDPNAPDIAFQVRRDSDCAEIGVFGFEDVEVLR